MLDQSQVSAVIVTGGRCDLQPVIDSLDQFDEVIVLDNSTEAVDMMTYGIVAACERARNPIVFSQDDDIIHTRENQARIVAKYRPGILTGCMWAEWSAGAAEQGIENGYDDLVFYGSGAVYDYSLPGNAAARYLEHHDGDGFFRLWFSCAFGVLAPTRQLDVRFEARPCAEADYRMCNLPDGTASKARMIRRARAIRDMKPSAHAVYLGEHRAGKVREHRYL